MKLGNVAAWVVLLWPIVPAVSWTNAAERAATAASKTAVTAPSDSVAVGPELDQLLQADWIAEDRRFAAEVLAGSAGKQASSGNPYGVTTTEDAAGGCDGVKNGRWGFHTESGEQDPWWQVDLGDTYRLDRIVVYNRTDRGTASRTRSLQILVSPSADCPQFEPVYQHGGKPFGGVEDGKPLTVSFRDKPVAARMVRLAVPGRCSFALDEVEVFAADDPEKNIALGKPADQKSVGRYSYPGTLPEGVDSAPPPARAGESGGFSTAHIRAVIERAGALAERLRPKADPARLQPLVAELAGLAERLAKMEQTDAVSEPARRELFFRVRRTLRAIAFCNPLLDFDKILFITRHDSAGVFHMCDQYYGCNAVPGGGLFVLEDPFGPNPRLRNLLAHSVVESGRLKGRRLEGGTFLSPELSFDGQTILFAYTEAAAWEKYRGKEAYEWTPECCYHIFKCRADGSGLVQLTDGPQDDFDPCFLPEGRIAFVSERRGGYLRCGRHCPVYTLFAMEPDGSGIHCLSFHETHEWHPSVAHDGRIVYTRWDYVDRDTNIAHHMWTCHPDGSDPRSFHGNYPVRRESRPWMEMSIRAVPNSPKFVAVTGAHHGHAFGSLVLIDPRLPDDGAMSQLVRLTPEVPFPEAEARPIQNYMVYGTPWPLSEEDYLCVYDAEAKNRGIYWIDGYGNRELLYRNREISCLSPIPLRPRPQPPIVAPAAQRAEAKPQATATVAVMNVYESDFQWPPGTKIRELRIIQLLPKSTAPPNQPRIGVANQTNARAVLGTVPVEADGSVHFQVPAGVPIYFQALDERGMAVQSMRSVTYARSGRELTCLGCHEPKPRTPQPSGRLPLALGRGPSQIVPEPEGSNPFSFVRLVQPVLDRHCAECHRQKKTLDLSATIEGPHHWTRSYSNLAGRWGFYFHVSNGSINSGVHGGSRTQPGKFGAAAAPLLKYLDESHYNVRLSQEDFRRLTLWLDCNSEFFGTYENTTAQARGEVVLPSLQ